MHVAPPNSTTPRLDLAVVVFFLLVLVAPTIDECVRERGERGPKFELRPAHREPLAPADLAEFDRWPGEWELWYGDGFGLRDAFLTVHSALHYFVFRNPPAPMFVVGDDDWIFFRTARTIDDFRGLVQLGPSGWAKWKQRLEARRDYLARLGVRYAFVVVPNKESIYPERFPPHYTRIGTPVYDQILRQVRAHSDVNVVDLHSVFRAAKARDTQGDYLYNHDGTHWTPRGGFLAVRALTELLAREFPGAPVANRAELGVWERRVNDSLLRQMYLTPWIGGGSPLLVPKEDDEPPVEGANAIATLGRHAVYRTEGSRAPRVLVFHDSFMPYIERALANYTSELTLEWTHRFDPVAIANAQPDIVIDLTVERALLEAAQFDFEPPAIEPSLGFGASTEVVGYWDARSVDAQPYFDPDLRPSGFEGASGGRVRIVLTAEPRALVLPESMTGDGRDLRLHIELEGTEDADVELRYRCRGARVAEPGPGSRRELHAGRMHLYFDLDGAEVEGSLELWLSGRGSIVFREVETRRAADRQGTRR
jgi:alginate O-acetyltransferase complex protein AlgJ